MNTTVAQGRLERISQVSPFEIGWPLRTLLETLYAQHGFYRAYHNLRHIEELAAAYIAVRNAVGWERPYEIFAALLMHDAVMIDGATDNELRTADFTAAILPALLTPQANSQINFDRVSILIRLTAQHGYLEAEGLDQDTRHFLDADMSILGADRARFLEYNADVAREYEGVVSYDAYRRGRRGFLSWLARPQHRIYLSDFFHERLEHSAKTNLNLALKGLQ